MRIVVIGAGAIGCLVAGYLKNKLEDVTLIGRSSVVEAIKEKGLAISGSRGDFLVPVSISEALNYTPDLAILATKTQDLDLALRDNLSWLQNSLILTTQNGLQADILVSKYLPKENIISSIVMFGATALEPGKVVHNFEGGWILGNFFNPPAAEFIVTLSPILDKAFPTIVSEDIKGMKYLKVFVNANNCLPAIIGKSMQETFSDLDISQISIAIWKEGFGIFDRLKINLTSLPGFPVENITKLIALPSLQAAGVFSKLMNNLSRQPLYGSILQSIMRGKLSEIDYINGEFLRLAQDNNLQAPLNKVLVGMVHEIENTGKFFSKDDLIKRVKGLI
ncbi:MAG: ketopantoate reductase family protein [Candidatus Omnitrophota bacterium]